MSCTPAAAPSICGIPSKQNTCDISQWDAMCGLPETFRPLVPVVRAARPMRFVV